MYQAKSNTTIQRLCAQKRAMHSPANNSVSVARWSAQRVWTGLTSRCHQPQIQDVHVQNTAVKLSPSRQKGSSLSMDKFASSRQKFTSCKACLKHFFFWRVCSQFSSFCLGQDWNPSCCNTSVNLQESCTGSASVGQPNQLLTRPLLCLASRATRQMDFNSGLCQHCPRAGKERQEVLRVDPTPHPLACTPHSSHLHHRYYTATQQRTPTLHLEVTPSPQHPQRSPRTKGSPWRLSTSARGWGHTSDLSIGCMSH